MDQLTSRWLQAAGGGREDCRWTCHQPLTPQARRRLSRSLLHLAIDAVSGPRGLAAFLRSRQLGAPFNTASLPLDIGASKEIPDYLRRAVIRRDRHCAWPGCDKPPAACEPHHLTPRSQGGKTELRDLKLLCWFHHHVCIHRHGWQVTAHPDGSVTARAPWGQELHSHQPLPRTG